MAERLSVIGVPSSAAAYAIGPERTPSALREAGLLEQLRSVCSDVEDLGDSPVVPWRPDPANPRAQNLALVVEQVRLTAARVAAALRAGRTPLVVGGDCTVGIGTVAGAREALGSVGLVYFDLHSDLNTRTSVVDGSLSWRGIAHMLGTEGTEPELASAGGPAPLLSAGDLLLFAHGDSEATPWERDQIRRLGLRRIPVEDVAADPEGTARTALELIGTSADRFVVHFDVDVIDFTDAPLSENTGQNVGLSFATAMSALHVLLGSERVCGLTIGQLNPAHAAAVPGLLERFVASLAAAWGG